MWLDMMKSRGNRVSEVNTSTVPTGLHVKLEIVGSCGSTLDRGYLADT